MILKSMQQRESFHTSNELDRTITEVMARHSSVLLAILFGSMAKDRARNDSDLDIAVACSTPLTPRLPSPSLKTLHWPLVALWIS